jgi:hypothetical protein
MEFILILVRKSENEFRGRSLSFPLLGAAAGMPGARVLLVLSGLSGEDAAVVPKTSVAAAVLKAVNRSHELW